MPQYVGNKKCKMCHVAWYRSWMESAKGDSFESLMPGSKASLKILAGLDPERDYGRDERCLSCHSVGFGRPSGYRVPDPENKRAVRFAAVRAGVGCEACHGPGGDYVHLMREIMKEKRSYDPAELTAFGRRTVSVDTCHRCHNDQAICQVGTDPAAPRPYDPTVDVHDRSGYHGDFPLRYRKRP
jgi:hypothetical protein